MLAACANASHGFRAPDNVNAFPTLGLITAWSYEGGLKLDEWRVVAFAAAFQMDVSEPGFELPAYALLQTHSTTGASDGRCCGGTGQQLGFLLATHAWKRVDKFRTDRGLPNASRPFCVLSPQRRVAAPPS